MFQLLDDALERFLRAEVPLDASVDVALEIPDREWSATLTRPTVNLCLFDVRRDSRRPGAGVETVQRAGRTIRRAALPRVQVTYLLTVWAGDHRDEHALLGSVLAAVLRRRVLPVPDNASVAGPVDLLIADDIGAPVEFWRTIDGRFRAGVGIQLLVPVETGLGTEVGPEVDVVEARVADRQTPTRSSRRVRSFVEERGSAGGAVGSAEGPADGA